MQRYVVDKRDHQWVVSANGIEQVRCKEKNTAVRMARRANELLRCETAAEVEAEIPKTDIH